MPSPCVPLIHPAPVRPVPLVHRIVHGVHRAPGRVWHHAVRHVHQVSHVAPMVGPVVDTACKAGPKVAALAGLLGAPLLGSPAIVPTSSLAPEPAALTMPAGLGPWGGGGRTSGGQYQNETAAAATDARPADNNGSTILYGPLDSPSPIPSPESVLRPYVAARTAPGVTGPQDDVPDRVPFAAPLRVQDLPEPASLTVLGGAVAVLAMIRRRRDSCRKPGLSA